MDAIEKLSELLAAATPGELLAAPLVIYNPNDIALFVAVHKMLPALLDVAKAAKDYRTSSMPIFKERLDAALKALEGGQT
jgi:hypothetical protein